MENEDGEFALLSESNVSDASRRQIGAAILGIFGSAVLSDCANTNEQPGAAWVRTERAGAH